jgi:hypothetical protein
MTDLEILQNAEVALTDTYLMALSTDDEKDWHYAKLLRAICDKRRLDLGLPMLNDPSARPLG